jgi:hypothetical protein
VITDIERPAEDVATVEQEEQSLPIAVQEGAKGSHFFSVSHIAKGVLCLILEQIGFLVCEL